MADDSSLRALIGAESRNMAADYGVVDLTGAVSSAAAIERRVNFVSVGANCLPKLALIRGGLLAAGSRSMPLDLCLSSDNGALRTVIADFEGLTDPARLVWDRFGDCVRNEDLEIVFCHERGEKWRADNYAALRGRYQKRVANFRDMLRTGQDTLFVYVSHTRFTEETRQLLLEAAGCLERRTIGSSAVLAIITGGCEADLCISEKQFVRILDLPLPWPNYVFHKPTDYSSDAGLAFERSIVSAATNLSLSLTSKHSRAA